MCTVLLPLGAVNKFIKCLCHCLCSVIGQNVLECYGDLKDIKSAHISNGTKCVAVFFRICV